MNANDQKNEFISPITNEYINEVAKYNVFPTQSCIGGMKQRSRFTKEEDNYLRTLVQFTGSQDDPNWNEIAAKMIGRTARQCRERYRNYLQPGLDNGPWTHEEDDLLEAKYNEMGPQWCKLVHFFPHRSDVNIKNHYTCLLNRYSRENYTHVSSADVSRNVSPSNSIANILFKPVSPQINKLYVSEQKNFENSKKNENVNVAKPSDLPADEMDSSTNSMNPENMEDGFFFQPGDIDNMFPEVFDFLF